jgi:hypothetical protein
VTGGEQVRQEAERLVAAALATVSGLAAGHGARYATGSAECCVCPVCRVIAAVREPSPEASERLATGVGDLATGIASMLRSLSGDRRAPEAPADSPNRDDPVGSPAPAAESWHGGEDPWHAATTQTPSAPPAPAATPKPMAKKAVRKAPPPNEGTEAGV